ncbi:MAG: sedoheptulose-bisphosphatase [Bacillariaceae sp.]|jgi:sedoheptulose-bisphosphatase
MITATSAFAPTSLNTPTRSVSTQLYGEYGASSTSFYTTTEKQDSYASLEEVLAEKCSDDKVKQVIVDMLEVCADITEALRTALVTVEDTSNEFGDTQLSVDVSTKIIIIQIRHY